MITHTIRSIAFLSLLGLGACGGAADPFPGVYSGNFSKPVGETSPIMQNVPDTGAGSISISEGATDDIVLGLASSLTTQGVATGCPISASRDGSSATITPGQSCTVNLNGGGSLTYTVSNGSATLNGNALTVNIGGNVTGSIGGEAITGTFTYTFTGSKK
jgi:hypothetical protein